MMAQLIFRWISRKQINFRRMCYRTNYTVVVYALIVCIVCLFIMGPFVIKYLREIYLWNNLDIKNIFCEMENSSKNTTQFLTDNCKRILNNLIHTLRKPQIPLLIHSNTNNLPINFDARLKWFNCNSIRYIRDQGSCGSCWAVAVVSTITDRICIHSESKISKYISEEDLLSCCINCGYGCLGGNSMIAWMFWKEYGIVSGSGYNQDTGCKPYSFSPCIHRRVDGNCTDYSYTPVCSKNCTSKFYDKSYEQDRSYAQVVYAILPDERQIMKEIIENGPVQGTMVLYDDFIDYESGIYSPTKKSRKMSDHSVKIIGWGTDGITGMDFWIVSNSFNSAWGENGYFRIKRANTCNLQSEVYAGIPKF